MMTAAQARGARAILCWKVSYAAEKAGVSPNTITRVEGDGSVNTATLKAMRAAYEAAGIAFQGNNCVCAPLRNDVLA